MIKHGKRPYLECSSRGDKRFSAFYAKVNGKSIEDQYQAFKIFEDGSTGLSWREAKGKKAVNMDECRKFYKFLWKEYIKQNPDLIPVLLKATGLSDMFGKPGNACQATELWDIRNKIMFTLKANRKDLTGELLHALKELLTHFEGNQSMAYISELNPNCYMNEVELAKDAIRNAEYNF